MEKKTVYLLDNEDIESVETCIWMFKQILEEFERTDTNYIEVNRNIARKRIVQQALGVLEVLKEKYPIEFLKETERNY